jgi:hypothetical protein
MAMHALPSRGQHRQAAGAAAEGLKPSAMTVINPPCCNQDKGCLARWRVYIVFAILPPLILFSVSAGLIAIWIGEGVCDA